MKYEYEYEYEELPLNDSQLNALSMGLLNRSYIQELNKIIKEILNKRGADGWKALESLQSIPTVWFYREVTKIKGK